MNYRVSQKSLPIRAWIGMLDNYKRTAEQLEAAEKWFWRRILKISWTHKVSNKDVLIRAKSQRTLMETSRKKQLEFLGHL